MLIFILISYAVTDILVNQSIFKWLRKLLPFKPFVCPNCMSVWVGFGLSLLFTPIYSIYISWFIYGMISYTTYILLDLIISKNTFKLNDN